MNDQIKKHEMGREHGMYGRLKRCIQRFWWGELRERDHLYNISIDEKIILNMIFKK